MVAVTGKPDRLEVLLRRRLELLPPDNSVPRFVYHEASRMPASETVQLIRRAEAASRETTLAAVTDALNHLGSMDLSVRTAGIASGSRPISTDLPTVLGSHPMIHTAEGVLFQVAVVSACEGCGLAVISAREREVWLQAATAWGLKEAALRAKVDGLRKSVGAPWTTDQKTATAFALLALRHDV